MIVKRGLIIFALALSLLIPSLAFAGASARPIRLIPNCGSGSAAGQPDVCQDVSRQNGNNGKNNPIIKIIKAAINVLSFIIGAAAIIGIVVSGIRLMTSGGDSQAVASARSGLVYSLIGVATVVLAQTLVALVLDKVQ